MQPTIRNFAKKVFGRVELGVRVPGSHARL
jgi:hypothetical protein